MEAVDVVKPAGISTASISENRRNHVAQAGFEKRLQRKIDEIKGKTSLRSSPAPARVLQTGPHKAGFEIRARNIVQGFMSPDFKYRIGEDFQPSEGHRLITSDFAEYKEGKYKLGLYRQAVKGDVDSQPISPSTKSTTDRPEWGKRGIGGQGNMMLPGETDSSGQMRLISSPAPDDFTLGADSRTWKIIADA